MAGKGVNPWASSPESRKNHDRIFGKKEEETWWAMEGDEIISHDCPDDAFDQYVRNTMSDAPTADSGTMTANEFRLMVPTKRDVGDPLECILDRLDVEYGNPSDGDIEITDEMRAAEKAFIAAVLEEYRPWAMEQTGKSETVDIYEWVKENDLLED